MSQPNTTPAWRTSSYSDGGGCVETALDIPGVLVRDSKVGLGPIHTYDRRAWMIFTEAIKLSR
ncbi:DUF397 domain-containing protein [Embleya scabrispora]|uniref:DUF397 domain-containing protein n=1 Tax=Embleya scabrispora TaxID=159449 RepID=UPI000A3111CA|nr:DUF397 domain-containing protein [Embleya scabrispora]MYS84519.1 DUF397 domain-containing protein [Streptomyces sp. SID5474]